MPLVRLELRNEFALGDTKLYRGSAGGKEGTKEILDGLAVAGLVGILRQIGDFAEFAAEIFHDLHGQVMATSARGHKMLSRIKQIEESLPFIEDVIRGKGSYIDLAYESGSNWRSDTLITDSHLTYSNFPQFMMDSYERCRDPPRLYLLDKYDRAGAGACLKRYSDPSYFNRERVILKSEQAQHIQNKKKSKKIKRKYSGHRDGEIQGIISTSQSKSLASIARFAPHDDQCFSVENSSISEMRLKAEVMSGSVLLKTLIKMNTEEVVAASSSVMPNDMKFDSLSVSNVQNNQDLQKASQQHNNELAFTVDDDFQYDLMHAKNTSQSPSVIWDEKSELTKDASLKFSKDNFQDVKLFLVNSESSKKEEPTRNGSFDQAKPLSIIADLQRSSSEIEQFEEVTEMDSFMDALNTLETEVDIDSEYQTKCIKSLSNNGHQKNESEFAKIPNKLTYSCNEVPPALHDSLNKCMLPNDAYLDVSRTLELNQSTQEAGISPGFSNDGAQLSIDSIVSIARTNAFQKIDEDEPPLFNASKSENSAAAVAARVYSSSPISISNISSTKLWTNGNLLGLQPSKPPDIFLPKGAGEMIESDSLTAGMKSDTVNSVQKSQQLKKISKVVGIPEYLSLADQGNSNQSLSRKDDANDSMKHLSNGFCTKQKSQERSEAIPFSQHEGSQFGCPNVLNTGISQAHQTACFTSSMETEPHCASNFVSQSIDCLHNGQSLSPSFSRPPQRNLVLGLQKNPSITCTKCSNGCDPNVDGSRSEGKPLVDFCQKRLNGVASQTIYEQNFASQTQKQNVASQTSHEQNPINKTNNGLLKKSISSSSHHSRSSSPPLEHMKISFLPMNGPEAPNLNLEESDDCLSGKFSTNMFPSLFPGCTLPAQDDSSESDDTFCKSYPYSTEDLLSPCADSNSDLWERDDCTISKINELSDDLRRISSSTATISSYSRFEQRNHLGQLDLKDICSGSDTIPFQPDFISSIPSLESLINHLRHDSLSISPKNPATLLPPELPEPPPPPLPPTHWILLKPSYEIAEDNYSNIARLVNYFDGPLNQNLSASAENENIIQWPPTLLEDRQHKEMQDNQKMENLLQKNLSLNTYEHHRKEQFLHQIRDMDIQHKLKPYEELKGQIATQDGVEEREDLLQQIKTKTFNLRRTATSRPFATQPSTNNKVAAILEKANAIRQACAYSDEEDDSDEWSAA